MEIDLQLLPKQNFSNSLLDKLTPLLTNKKISTVWFGGVCDSNEIKFLWLRVKVKTEITKVLTNTFCKTVLEEKKIYIVLLDDIDIKFHNEIGNTNMKFCLSKENAIYCDTDTNTPSISCHYKYMEDFKQAYIEKQKLLTSYCNDFVKNDYNGNCYLYLKSFENDIDTLESILFGAKNTQDNLTDRLLILEKIIPKVKTLFVKKDAHSYFIIDSIENDYDAGMSNMWQKTSKKIQKRFRNIVLEVIDNINKKTSSFSRQQRIKSNKLKRYEHHEKLLPLIMSFNVEEIYKFHETVIYQEEKTIKHLYLLILTKEKVTKEFQKIINDLENKYEDIKFTIIAHTRFYIQDNAYLYTGFFKDITKKRNLVFSTGYYPKFHWYRDDEFDDDESMHYLRSPLRKVNKFIKKNITKYNADNYLATKKLFKCFHIKLKVYIIYNINYMPNTTNLNTLINLALYGANTTNSRLSELVKELPKSLLSFTQENNEQENKNLLLDEDLLKVLQRFFRALDN